MLDLLSIYPHVDFGVVFDNKNDEIGDVFGSSPTVLCLQFATESKQH